MLSLRPPFSGEKQKESEADKEIGLPLLLDIRKKCVWNVKLHSSRILSSWDVAILVTMSENTYVI